MSFRYAFTVLASSLIVGCGGLDGFKARNADLKLNGLATGGSQTPNFVSGPATISTKNAYFAIDFPAIFEILIFDPDTVINLVDWDHEFRNGEMCIERIRNGSYIIDCGSREGDLIVFMTYRDQSVGERTVAYQTYIEPYTNVTEAIIFPNGR